MNVMYVSRLMKPSGSLLVIVGDKSVEKIMGPFVSSMWKSYSVRGYKAFGARPLKLMMVDCQVCLGSLGQCYLLLMFVLC